MMRLPTYDAGLGCGVVDLPGVAHEPHHGADVHNATAALLGHHPQRRLPNGARGGGICPVSGPIARGKGAYARRWAQWRRGRSRQFTSSTPLVITAQASLKACCNDKNLAAVEGAGEVHIQHQLPLLGFHPQDQPVPRDACAPPPKPRSRLSAGQWQSVDREYTSNIW
eukprot:8724044-Pyramimonas_sp.AAC.1